MDLSQLLAALTAAIALAQPAAPSPAQQEAPAPSTSPPGIASSATPTAAVWPLDPVPDVVQRFDPPEHDWEPGHRGVDLRGRPGQVVRSALPGRVGFVGAIGGKPVVTVLHGGRRTTYEPVVASVVEGQTVAAGDPLGRLVTRSSHCFPATCLHWGLIEGEAYLDPLELIGAQPVRLLPLWRERPAG